MAARAFLLLGRHTRTVCNRAIGNASITRHSNVSLYKCNLLRRFYGSIHEPEYLSQLVPEIPIYDLLNIQMKGYDFTVLEHYAKYVAKTANHLDVEVEESWATPGTKYKIHSYKLGTTVVDQEYQLTLYERNVQVKNVQSTILPILIEVLQNALPEGLQLRFHPHMEEHETTRYIPDLELKALRLELEDVGNPLAKKKKKSTL